MEMKFYLRVGDVAINVYINHEKMFAFVEMRTVEEANIAMDLDGIMFEVHYSILMLQLPFYVSLKKSLTQLYNSRQFLSTILMN